MGSLETGLSLLSPKSWARVWRGEYFLAGSESITQTQSGRLLAAKPAGGLSEYDSKEEQWKKLPGQFGAGHAWNSIEESNGDVWTIIQDVGIFRLNSKNQQTAVVFRGSMKDIDFRCLLRDRTGQIWVGAKRGLYRIDESGSPKLVQVALPGNSGYAGAFTTDASGQEWLGYDGGIARLEHGEWKLVIPQQALLSPRIRSLAVAPGPAFWVSYRAALPFSKVYRGIVPAGRGRTSPLATVYGPTETSSMLVDGHGWVWRGTDEGLFVSDGVHLAADDWLKFDKFNGLASDAVGTFGLTEDRDGVIWVSTDEGAARIQPDSNWFAPVSARSRPQVTALRWGGKQYLWPGPGEKLPAVPSPLEVDVSEWPEVSPRTPRIQFRLWPQEKEWKTAFDSTVRYNFLPPGNYRFDVRSVNSPATLSREFQIVRSGGFDWWWPLGGLVGSAGAGWWGWQRLRRSRLANEYWEARRAFVGRGDNSNSSAFKVGDTVAGRYTLEERVGEGGFASVYRARDTSTGEIVAIKILKGQDEFPDWQRRRFEREIESLRRIDHPGIVRLLDSGWLSESEPYVVMDFVAGPTLRTVLASAPLNSEQSRSWILEIGEALGEAHAHGVLHRDLKPENILLEAFGTPSQHPVIVDFGAALIKDQSGQNGTSFMLVSIHYSAPERARGRSSTASDVYSLAAIAFEMFTGIRFATLMDGDETELAKELVGWPSDLVRLLAEGTQSTPSARPQDIRLFARALAQALPDNAGPKPSFPSR